MQLRLLSSSKERQEFGHNLVRTRISKGAGFSETKRSLVGEAHLTFGKLYALFDEHTEQPNEMIAGFVMHDLGSFPQSYPKPDLTNFPPEAVIECGELWAKAAGSAQIVRQAAWILAGQLKSEAVLLYPIFKPWNLSRSYIHDFDRAGDPIEWPYAKTLEGGKIYVQAMVSSGAKLANMVAEAGRPGFYTDDALTVITFNTVFPISRRRERENAEVVTMTP